MLERALAAHLGYDRHEVAGRGPGNSVTGTLLIRCRPESGRCRWPCRGTGPGRPGPLLIPKRAGRVSGGLDDMIISLYAHGMSVRDILHHLEQVYGTKLSAEMVSRITDQVLEEVRAWQSRPGPG